MKYYILLILFLVNLYGKNDYNILKVNSNILNSLYFLYDDDCEKIYHEVISNKNKHPLQIGSCAIKFLIDYSQDRTKKNMEKVLTILKVIDSLKKIKYKNFDIYVYPFNYREFHANKWWSAMANSSIGIAYLLGYKLFLRKDYLLKSQRAMEAVISPVNKGGCALNLDSNSSWYLEYVNKKRNKSNSYFVLNGFQYSLIALNLYYKLSNDYKYFEYYQRGINAYKLFSKKYYYKDFKWTYYMLNPLTIESPHYAIFDMLLTKLLSNLDNRNSHFLLSEYNKRKKIFLNNYYFEKCNNKLLFSAIGAPHPYWIDIYPIDFKIIYKNNSYIHKYIVPKSDFNIDITKRLFLIIRNYAIKKIIGTILFNDQKFTIGSFPIVSNKKSVYKFSYKVLPYYDLNKNNNGFFSCKEINKKIIKFVKLGIRVLYNRPIDIKKYKFFGAVLNLPFNIQSIRIILIDSNGNSIERYYLPLKKGKQLILLSILGFKHESIFGKLKEMRIVLIKTKNIKQCKNKFIKFEKFYLFNSKCEIFNLLTKKNIKFLEKTK